MAHSMPFFGFAVSKWLIGASVTAARCSGSLAHLSAAAAEADSNLISECALMLPLVACRRRARRVIRACPVRLSRRFIPVTVYN